MRGVERVKDLLASTPGCASNLTMHAEGTAGCHMQRHDLEGQGGLRSVPAGVAGFSKPTSKPKPKRELSSDLALVLLLAAFEPQTPRAMLSRAGH